MDSTRSSCWSSASSTSGRSYITLAGSEDERRGRRGAPFVRSGGRLRGRVRVGPPEDVRVAERGRAVLLRSGPRDALAGSQGHPPGVYSRTVRGVAGIVPHRSTVGSCRSRVDVVAEEFGERGIVLAGAASVPRRA